MAVESWRKARHRSRAKGALTKAGKPRAKPATYNRKPPKGGIVPRLAAGSLLEPQPDLPPGPTWQCGSCRARVRLGEIHTCVVSL